jgi:hypothetical protein
VARAVQLRFPDPMAHVDPLIAQRPEFADTQPDLSLLTPRSKTILARLKRNAAPLLIGAGVGAGVVLAVAALSPKKRPRLTLFPAHPATLGGKVAKIALLAVGRVVLRRAFAHAVETIATRPADSE